MSRRNAEPPSGSAFERVPVASRGRSRVVGDRRDEFIVACLVEILALGFPGCRRA
jgi:hypothetical protein